MDLSSSWNYIEEAARKRLTHNKTDRHNDKYGDRIEIIGVAGEIVARRFLGVPETVHYRFDHGIDIYWHGLRIDVKATHLTPNAAFRYLQWPEWKEVRADLVVATCIDPITKTGTIIGYATRDEIKSAYYNPSRKTPCREIAFNRLHPAWELEVMVLRHRTREAHLFPTQETVYSHGR